MERDFSIGIRFIGHVGLLEALSFFGEGVGAALYIVASATGHPALAAAGVVFVAGAVVALLAHLGRPLRAWRALSRLGSAWVSRGTLLISLFVGSATLSLLATWLDALQVWAGPLTAIALCFAVPVIVYAGMLLRSMRAIRLWRGPWIPAAFSMHSLATGLMLTWAAVQFLPGESARHAWLFSSTVAALSACAAISMAHLVLATRSAGVDASLARLLRGDLRQVFLGGAGMFGLVIPLAVLASSTQVPVSGIVLALVGLARLCGDLAYRYAICRAGAYEPVAPVEPVRNVHLALQ